MATEVTVTTAVDGGTKPDGAPSCRSAGCPCQSHSDCTIACAEKRDGSQVCAAPCASSKECATGQVCDLLAGGTVCVDPLLTLCDPCATQNDCKAPGAAGAACIQGGDGGGRCGVKCLTSVDCPTGFACEVVTTTAGSSSKQCAPQNGVCACSPRAIAHKLASACSLQNSAGTCTGKRVCGPDGLAPCQGAEPKPEVCNGYDDNCNNATDENANCDDANPCSNDICGGIAGCEHSDAIEACDDDNPCTVDTCDPKVGCFHSELFGCVVELPHKQAFACAEKPAWELSPPVPGAPRWTLDAIPKLGVFIAGYKSAACSLNFNLGTSMQCAPDGNSAQATATSPMFSTAALGSNHAVSMRFWLGGTWRTQDVLTVVILAKGDTLWQTVHSFAGGPSGGGWQQVEIKLPQPAPALFRLRLHMVAPDCAKAANLTGPFVDDVEVGGTYCKKATDCDDGNACTDDGCVPSSKLCNHKNNALTVCSDGNPCTIQDACKNGACQGKAALLGTCDDGNSCTIGEKCAGGECVGSDFSGDCDDSNACTGGDSCSGGVCAGTLSVNCDDKNPCTYDVCDLASGKCAAAISNEAVACDDGDACSDASVCHLGVCIPRFFCDDGNPCTQDSCAGLTCSHLKVISATPCTDSNACTEADACTANSSCLGMAAPCAIAQTLPTVCTDNGGWDLPVPATAEAAWRMVTMPAAVGVGCALGFTNGTSVKCADTTKVSGTATRTLDLTGLQRPVLKLRSYADVGKSNQVNLRWIDISHTTSTKTTTTTVLWLTNDGEKPGVWRHLRIDLTPWQGKVVQLQLVFDSASCPDTEGLGWLVSDLAVHAGVAKKCQTAPDCEDGNSCTAEVCLGGGWCSHQTLLGKCEDGNGCTAADACTAGGDCAGATLTVCDDGDICTLDFCLAAKGCVNAPRPDGDPCPDGNACTVGDFCVNGKCTTRPKCDDGNLCTKDECVQGGTCQWEQVNGGTACDDGSPCTAGDHCSAGHCVGATVPCSVVWQDAIDCSAPWELVPLPGSSTVTFGVDATPSPPGFHSGGCSLNVNDGKSVPCVGGIAGKASASSAVIDLQGLKDPALWLYSWHDVGTAASQNLRLIEVSSDNFATIAIVLWQDNAVGDKSWQRVRISLVKIADKKVRLRLRWSGLNCIAQSGKGWFVDDLQIVAAQPTACAQAGACNDGDVCTDDSCAGGSCVYAPNQITCTDGDECTVGDQCWKGYCLAKPKLCEDGNVCTLDSCDAVAGCSAVVKVDGAKCDDGNSCSSPDGCQKGLCGGPTIVADNAPCSSSAPCTQTQTCFKGKCQGGKMIADGTPCDDGNPCNPSSACDNSLCKASVVNVCDDFEACTLDACFATADGPSACSYIALANSTACDDGDPCTEKTACGDGVCDGPQLDNCVIITASNFDTGAAPKDWELDPVVSKIGWQVDALPNPPTPHSLPYSLNFNNNVNVDIGVPIKGGFVLPKTTLPLQGTAQLTFWSWHDGEKSNIKDKRTVEVLYVGGTIVQEAVQLPNHLRRGLWSKVRVNLSKFAGKSIVVKLRYETVDQFDNETAGWFVDDLRLQIAQPASCTLDALCAQPKDPCKPTKCAAGLCTPEPLTGSCDDGDACTVQTTCQKGACLGVMRNCDDGYACSIDLCESVVGCFHKTIDGCGEFALPYEATFTCGQAANSYWLRDGPQADGAPAWHMDASPNVPGPLSPDCTLNCNNGENTACPLGVTSIETSALSPVLSLAAFKFGAPVKARINLAGTWQPGLGEKLFVDLQPYGLSAWTILAQPTPPIGWQVLNVDLTPWAGFKLRLRLRYVTSCQPAAGVGSGPFVDDVQVFDVSCKSSSVCNDNNPCTEDVCDLKSGLCQVNGISGPLCDDSNPCTLQDGCASGQCLGLAKVCDDGQPCTIDACDPGSGQCVASQLPQNSPCNDGQSCTTGDICKAKGCAGNPKAEGSPCSDGNPCSVDDGCVGGTCVAAGKEADGSGCTDGNPCTAADSCNNGQCASGTNACDDGDACTTDLCTPVGSVGKKCAFEKVCP
ncbi:MAG: hypothetical protein EXR77_00710 [Myxococcales bacterium]|nr:hypothetical protein [Myxococcales bacterium]